MPKSNIKNLIIFGDSMSDIGNKRSTGTGKFARFLHLMRVNEIGRFSDGKNWTDFVWEWAGARSLVQDDKATTDANTEPHLSLTRDSSQDSGFGRPITYVNYAEGGAMGASDRPSTGLGTFKQQVQRYMKEREAFPLQGDTLHVIWFGLNDLVTNERPPETMGVVVDEIGAAMRAINMELGKAGMHFLVVNLPSPAGAMRYLAKSDLRSAISFDKGAQIFNKHLEGLTDGHYYDVPAAVTPVDMYTWLGGIMNDPAQYGLDMCSQPRGVPVVYSALKTDPAKAYRNCVATSDDAHPTEAVYRLIAQRIAVSIVTRYELGTLSTSVAVRSAQRRGMQEMREELSFDIDAGQASHGHWVRRGNRIFVFGA